MFQPYTTDNSTDGKRIARNVMRLRLWADDVFAHRWLVHPNVACIDGCDANAKSERLSLYESDIEG